MIRKYPWLIALTLLIISCDTKSREADSSFTQLVKKDIDLPKEAAKEVLKLFKTPEGIVAVTPNGFLKFEQGSWEMIATDDPVRNAATDPNHVLWLISGDKIQNADGSKKIDLPYTAKQDSLNCLFWENFETLHLGTSGGLYTWNGKWSEHPELKGISVNDLVKDAAGVLWLASSDGLWQRSNEKWVNLDETLMAIGNHRRYFSLATRNEGKDLVFSAPLSIGIIAEDGEHKAWRGPDGLPYGPANVIRTFGENIWLGTNKGAILKNSNWHYFHGARWLKSEKVNDILEIQPGVVWIATSSGISEIEEKRMTLSEKAAIYSDVIEERHNRRGLVNISKMSVPGDLTTSYTENEDNDGLWTSCFLAAECFRYAVTKSPDAKEKAIRTFEALERLETITGIPGYPARSYALVTDTIVQSKSPHPKYWHLSPDKKWWWLDDTSSDEITGHMFTLSLFYELVADDSQKKRIISLIDRIATHILDNDFHLIDPDGKPTRWGVWHPDSLNNEPNWAYERGLNSLQILSHLKTAYHFTQNPRYENVYQELISKHGYLKNAVEAKIYGPYETSHSDDILNFFPYYALFKYAKNDPHSDAFRKSLERSWKAVQNDRMPVWNVIASALLQKDCDLKIAREELQQYPIDLIDWTMKNNHRWDISKDPLVDRSGQLQALLPIPTPESGVSRWNTNPKRMDVGKGGMTEESGTYFLFAYWAGRHYGFWKD